MNRVEIDAQAKINITLDVLYKRTDGYHEVEMVMQSISLKDYITIELLPQKVIEIEADCPNLACDETNIAYKAAKLMMDKFNLDAGVRIRINKNIPIAAGLAGGSSNAAAVVLGINELFDLKKSKEELTKLGKTIGADVPFCIYKGTALAKGIGEQLQKLKPIPKVPVLIVKPPYSVSTKEIYGKLDIEKINERPDTPMMLKHIEKSDVHAIAKGLCNVMEEVTFKLYPELAQIKAQLKQYGALGSLMSGSGPTVFGVFESKRDLLKAQERLSIKHHQVLVSEIE